MFSKPTKDAVRNFQVRRTCQKIFLSLFYAETRKKLIKILKNSKNCFLRAFRTQGCKAFKNRTSKTQKKLGNSSFRYLRNQGSSQKGPGKPSPHLRILEPQRELKKFLEGVPGPSWLCPYQEPSFGYALASHCQPHYKMSPINSTKLQKIISNTIHQFSSLTHSNDTTLEVKRKQIIKKLSFQSVIL